MSRIEISIKIDNAAFTAEPTSTYTPTSMDQADACATEVKRILDGLTLNKLADFFLHTSEVGEFNLPLDRNGNSVGSAIIYRDRS